MSIAQDFKRYRWFVTSGKTVVVGGKNAEQNDELLKRVIGEKKSFYIMHTSAPGSPFSVMLKERKKITDQELTETAIFTACFSQAWKHGVPKARIDIFTAEQVSKTPEMKAGMWRVQGTIRRIIVPLELALTTQRGLLRAVPLSAAKRVLARLTPGKADKQQVSAHLGVSVGQLPHDQLVAALPTGGITVTL